MAANRFGIDVASLYRDKANIEGARTRNKMAALQLGEAEREIKQRPIREAAEKERNVMLTGLRQKAATGDTDAARQFLAVGGDPSFIDAVGKMDDRQLKKSREAIEEKGRMLATVRNAKPERQAGLYMQMLSMLPDDQKKNMPTEYDPNFVDVSLSKMMAMDKILENPKSVKLGGEDVLYKQGLEVDRAKRPVKTGTGTGTGTGGLKSGDESLMYRQAAELLGGMFDAAGNLQALDPETRTKAQAIATEATNLFRNGGITRTQAVADAAKKYGIEMPGQTGDNDPLGLR